jgi:hypothetical protein
MFSCLRPVSTEETYPVLCECASIGCWRSLAVPEKEVERVRALAGHTVIILDACEHGPEPQDELLERRTGYSVYKDGLS